MVTGELGRVGRVQLRKLVANHADHVPDQRRADPDVGVLLVTLPLFGLPGVLVVVLVIGMRRHLAQLDTVAGVDHLHVRVGRSNAFHPRLLERHAGTHVQHRIRQGGDLLRRRVIGVRVETGAHHARASTCSPPILATKAWIGTTLANTRNGSPPGRAAVTTATKVFALRCLPVPRLSTPAQPCGPTEPSDGAFRACP
jgi:hypothetical protein